MSIKKITTSLLVVIAVFAFAVTVYADTTIVVTSADMQGWNFREEIATGTGAMVNGPETAPLGNGSAELTVDDTGRMLLETLAYRSTRLADIDALTYSTYRVSGSSALAPSLQFNIDYDDTDSDTSWQGRLVYEPYLTHTVTTDEWQTWNTQDDAVGGNWWASGAPGNTVCPQANPCTWTEVLTDFPDAAIRDADYTGILFKAGGPWTSGFVGNVDAFTIGINGDSTTYDFEPAPPTKADILINSGVPGEGLEDAPGLQKPFNENSKAAQNAGKKN